MTLEKWKKLSDKLVIDNGRWEYRTAKFVLPHGKEIEYNYIHTKGGSMIVGVNSEGKVALVSQYRATIDTVVLEFPAGGLQKGKDSAETAAAELAEETGFGARQLEHVGDVNVSPGLTDMMGSMFVAWDLYEDKREQDETEDLEVHWASPSEVDEMILDHRLSNAWSICAWALAKPKVLEIIALQK